MNATAIPITASTGIKTVNSVKTLGSIASASVVVPLTITSPAIPSNPKPKGNINAITIKLTAIIITFLIPIANFLHFHLILINLF